MTLRSLLLMIQKDLAVEWRTKSLLISTITFAALLVLLLGFSLPDLSLSAGKDVPGLFWLIALIAGYISLNRQDDKERYDGAVYGNLLIPVDRSVIFYGRWIANALFMLAVLIVMIPLFLLIVHQSLPAALFPFLMATLLAVLGFTAMGTFLTTLASASNLREIVVPILLFPMAIPLFLAALTITRDAWFQQGLSLTTAWWAVLVGYLVLFLVLPGLLFEIIVEV